MKGNRKITGSGWGIASYFPSRRPFGVTKVNRDLQIECDCGDEYDIHEEFDPEFKKHEKTYECNSCGEEMDITYQVTPLSSKTYLSFFKVVESAQVENDKVVRVRKKDSDKEEEVELVDIADPSWRD